MSSIFSGYNDGRLLFLGSWGPLWLALFAVLALAVLALTWLDLRELTPRRRWTLLVLRASVLLLGVSLAAEPALELRDISIVPNHVAVLFDGSASMELPARDGVTRQEVLEAQARELAAMPASDKHRFDAFLFGSQLLPTSARSIATVDARARQTDILAALDALKDRYAGETLGGVVLVTDGADNATLSARVAPGEALDELTLESIAHLNAPIHTIAIADEDAIRDVAIRRVRHDEFAFVRNAVSVVVELEVRGFHGQTLPVHLRRDGELLQTRQVPLVDGETHYAVEFEFVPELIGKEVYSVDTPVLRREDVTRNNRDFFVLRVIRDKIRVLQVVGRPSWDVRFLRQLLKGDPNVELISFFILRTAEDLQRAPDNEMALIPFPTDELFHEQLGSFDLIVLQNFTYRPYGMRQYLPDIRDYVKRGGGLLVIGGEQSFSAGGYAGTEVAEVLPVELVPGNPGSMFAVPGTVRSTEAMRWAIDTAPFRPQLTEAGERHPITRLDFDRRANHALWEELPPMPGTNIVGRARPGAVVLATHPTRRAGNEPMPVLAISDQGKGRSMAMTYDGSWRWNFDWILDGGSSRPYASFWNSAIRWLIRDPALNLLQIDIGQTVVPPGSAVDVALRAFRTDYTPAVDTKLRVQVFRRSLDSVTQGSGGEELVQELELSTDAQGRARLAVQADGEAAWRVHATALVEEDVAPELDEIFLSVDHSDELREVEPRNDLLRQISDATGGTHRAGPTNLATLRYLEPRAERVNRRTTIDVWSSPWILLAIAVLLAAEWQLRRRWGRL